MSPSLHVSQGRREFASEIKFLVSPAAAEEIRAWSRTKLAPDPNAGGDAGDTYHVTSLYYDTPDFAIFHRRGWLRHSKFRVRRYGSGALFLERKLKIAGLVAKRRAALSPPELPPAERLPDHARWFAEKTTARCLHPVCQIDYRRTARVALTPTGPIRLTLDEAICAQGAQAPCFRCASGGVPLTSGVILELKFRRDLPVMFRELVSQFILNPQSFSKYRTAVETLGLAARPAPAVPAEALSAGTLACPNS